MVTAGVVWRRRATSVAAACLGAGQLMTSPAWATTPVLTSVSPPGPVLAGSTVVLTAAGLAPDTETDVVWDGLTPSPEHPVAGAGGVLGAAAVTVPLSLTPGSHTVAVCLTAGVCSAGRAVTVGPLMSTATTQPVRRGQRITVSVLGLTPGAEAVAGWDGVLTLTGMRVPAQGALSVSATVPLDAGATDDFTVCERGQTEQCGSMPQTRSSLSFSVAADPPARAPASASVPVALPQVPTSPVSGTAQVGDSTSKGQGRRLGEAGLLMGGLVAAGLLVTLNRRGQGQSLDPPE